MTHAAQPSVLVICGSDSDLPRLERGLDLLDEFGILWELRVLSAHRTPEDAVAVVGAATAAGHSAIIAAAGLAAHLPGVVAAHTDLPVIGLPLASGPLNGTDALHSVVQMPPGVPVLTVGIDNARNAAVGAARILALSFPEVAAALSEFRTAQADGVRRADESARARSTATISTTREPAHA